MCLIVIVFNQAGVVVETLMQHVMYCSCLYFLLLCVAADRKINWWIVENTVICKINNNFTPEPQNI